MSKRVLSRASSSASSHSSIEHVRKRRREGEGNQPTLWFNPNYTASAEDAARVDADPPLQKFLEAASVGLKTVEGTEAVVHWMRMADLRIVDNRALSQASKRAREVDIPLIVLFVISPQDYVAHDRGPRRIDFVLRNLKSIKRSLKELNIPLYVTTHTPRRNLPTGVIDLLKQWNAKELYANIEYEVDELRRDIRILELAKQEGIRCTFIHDKLVVEPGTLFTQQGKPFAVFSPFHRRWIEALNRNLHWIAEASVPTPNDYEIHSHSSYADLFNQEVPDEVEGFECEDREKMKVIWPEGHGAAKEMLDRFLHTKSRGSQLGPANPLEEGAESSAKASRALTYKDKRDQADRDTTSRLSPYLSAGVISCREVVRATMELLKIKRVESSRDTSIGTWVQELAWRDFYTHIMCAWPRVSMGRPYQEKFAGVKWEVNEEHFNAWKEGRTGVPIVDAGMRQMNTMGWMHNRARMITAMYLTKDLMLDWRLGERYFSKMLIDSDLASNNGGWQWSSGTGTDPQPYFRIFNPYNQSEKADPTGNYIREFVPELGGLRGPDVHKPSPKTAQKLGYPLLLIEHGKARDRALRRYKNPGME
ncbi:hypothetical protein BDM02DRAFT_3087670 [Thelephora ganbajun]|uniref:Uncharacterized protein n=1 Tax=Thelephora ganbajun TaxID=370292 RepID=A0ACB6ZUR4_THEGA|nr:hypothetical protein BDM02DRAFT_3087670 [Thelephora ganbajun]